MSSDNNIKDQFKSKFDNYKVSPPVDGWREIEKSLDALHAPKVVAGNFNWKYAVAIAASLLLVVSSVLFLNQNNQDDQLLVSQTDMVQKSEPSSKTYNEPQVKADKIEEVTAQLIEKQSSNTISTIKIPSTPKPSAVNIEEIEANYANKDDEIFVTEPVADMEPIETNKDIEDTNEDAFEELLDLVQDDDVLLAYNDIHYDEKKPISISLTSKGGLTGYTQNVNTPVTLRSAVVQEDNNQPNIASSRLYMATNNTPIVAEMEHNQPVSFAITVSKELTDDLSIETGLVYTYLYSKSKNKSAIYQDNETQRLHYLGLPIILNYNLFSINNLNVYASVGGMIEKDVYGQYSRTNVGQSADGKEEAYYTEKEKISQKKPQISLNAGLGVSYPIFNQFKLYGKIGGAYYFDAKNRYSTIYSDEKIILNLSLGLRYEF